MNVYVEVPLVISGITFCTGLAAMLMEGAQFSTLIKMSAAAGLFALVGCFADYLGIQF